MARDVYCGRIAPMRLARPLMSNTRMTVTVGFEDEKRVRMEVYDDLQERKSNLKVEGCCWKRQCRAFVVA